MTTRISLAARTVLIALAISTITPVTAFASPGTPDTSFAVDSLTQGRVTLPGVPGATLAAVVPTTRTPRESQTDLLDPALWSVGTMAGDIAVTALGDSGTTTPWETGQYRQGRRYIDVNGTTDNAVDAKVDASGRLVIAWLTTAKAGFSFPYIARLTTAGADDTTFNSGRFPLESLRGANITALTLDSASNIFVGGPTSTVNESWVSMINPTNGVPFPAFGSSGIKRFPGASLIDAAADGVAGTYLLFREGSTHVIRHVDSTGAAVNWPSGASSITIPTEITPTSLRVDGSGFVVAGRASGKAAIVAFTSAGDLDATFNTGSGTRAADPFFSLTNVNESSKIILRSARISDYRVGTQVAPTRAYLLIGYQDANGSRFAMIDRVKGVRVGDPDPAVVSEINAGCASPCLEGAAITTFGTNGYVTIAPPSGISETLSTLDTDRNGKLLAGFTQSNGSFSIVRVRTYDVPEKPLINDADSFAKPGAIVVRFTPGATSAAKNAPTTLFYEANCTNASSNTTVVKKGTSSPITVDRSDEGGSSIRNGSSYTCQVLAVNNAGRSAPSDATRTLTPVSVPDAPKNTKVTGGRSAIVVEWSRPDSDGGLPILGYEAFCSATVNGSTKTESARTTEAFAVVKAVAPDGVTKHSCYARAFNEAGFSEYSASVDGVTDPLPAAPSNLVVEPGNTSLTVSFSPNVKKDPSTPSPTSYAVVCTATGSSGSATGSGIDPTRVRLTVTGLKNNLLHSCSATAVSSYGTSLPSAATPGTPQAIPATPIISSITIGESVEKIIVRVRPGAVTTDAGSADNFNVVCTPDITGAAILTGSVKPGASTPPASTPPASTPPASGADLSVILTGANPAASYSCVATATFTYTYRGEVSEQSVTLTSASTRAQTIRTGVVPQGAPAITAVTTGESVNQIAITFTPVTTANVTYRAECAAGATKLTGESQASPVTVNNVDPLLQYSCTVIAVGSGGVSPRSLALTHRTGQEPAIPSFQVSSAGAKTLAIDFPVSSTQQLPVTYQISCVDAAAHEATASGAGPRILVLVKYSGAYKCTGTAKNAIGTSLASSPSGAVDVTGDLATPKDPVLTQASGVLTITTDPVFAATSYRFTCTGPEEIDIKSKATSIKVTVKSGIYTCRTIASNLTSTAEQSGSSALFVAPVKVTAKANGSSTTLRVPVVAEATKYKFKCIGKITVEGTSKISSMDLKLGGGEYSCFASWMLDGKYSSPTALATIKAVPVKPKLTKTTKSIKLRLGSPLPKGLTWSATCTLGTITKTAKPKAGVATVANPGKGASCFITVGNVNSSVVKA